MEKYKKKSLKFMGFSRDLRNEARNTERALSRQQRFSLLRPLDEVESTPNEKKREECSSRIPMFGKSKDPRLEMLQKWKQEKMLKQQQQSKLKKPAFKIGVVEQKPPPVLADRPLFAVDMKSSRSFKSRLQTSQFQSEKNKSKLVEKAENNISRTAIGNKNLKPLSTNFKTTTSNTVESKLAKNKDSSALPTFSNRVRGLPVAVDSKNKIRQDQSSIAKKQPVLISKLKEPSKISSGLCKPTNSKLLTKTHEQTSRTEIPKKNTSKIQDVSIKSNQKGLPVKGNIAKSIAVRSGTITSKLKDSVFEKNKSEKEETGKKEKESKEAKDYNVKEDINIPLLADAKNITFRCEISYIEPVEEVRKSFAPDGFKFRPPIELNSSLFLNEGPSSIFTRMKNEHERTSTPKQKTVNQQQSPKKDIEDNIVDSEIKNGPDDSILNSVFCRDNDVLEDPVTSVQEEELKDDKVDTPGVSASTQEPILTISSDPSLEKSENICSDALEKDTVETFSENDLCTTEKLELLTTEDKIPSNAEQLQNSENGQICSNGLIPVKNNGLTSNYELRTRNFRRSEKPALESINETLETEKTPKSNKKNAKILQHNDFGPRRSLRLSKLSSSNFSPENLLDIRRPTLFGTPEKDEISLETCRSGLTYDFEKLELEDCSKFRAAHPRKVSLLYTPPSKGKQSLCKKSLGGDLMSFSPSM
ncbi:uncharacterized protein TNIN_155482 [Trichonephila inaurata madagascariensis]|uniref:Uncharacterized protein n=1 Tax=Trichonephila inaurata madagascariensis TaxID=2747483 RepID=A0A8X7CSM7_9ARAC|nr:uncharacterized protein TNIN_155482 [Trichonephila inaurata madagascariensis]